MSSRSNKRGDRPEYPLEKVRALAQMGKLSVEPRALSRAIQIFPYTDPRPRKAALKDITDIIEDLDDTEFEYRQPEPGKTPADIYKVNWEDQDLYLKLKIEPDIENDGDEVVAVISFKPWID